VKDLPEIIVIPRARLAAARIHRPAPARPPLQATYRATLLLDPSDAEPVKDAAWRAITARWGERENWPELALPFDTRGGAFRLRVWDMQRPVLGNSRGKEVARGEPECPRVGCIVRARVSVWTYTGFGIDGVSFKMRSLQFIDGGTYPAAIEPTSGQRPEVLLGE
jgi:hypothetical protein